MRKFKININGSSYEVEVEEVVEGEVASRPEKQVSKLELVPSVPKPSPDVKKEKKQVSLSSKQEAVEAPMPGNIWEMLVKEGDEVKAGDILLILEAMKMENEILAPRNGIVAKVNTDKGSAVNTGDILVVLD